MAPAPALDDGLRQQIIDAAVRFAKSVGYTNLGTFEFLVDVSGQAGAQPFVFIEANARLQVEHTVTEEVTGVDLVQAQIRLAQGSTLNELGLGSGADAARLRYPGARQHGDRSAPTAPSGPAAARLTVYEAPSGPGVRTDGFGYAGYRTSGAFDSLLAKVIAHSPRPDFAASVTRAARALSEFRIDGVDTNIPFLHNILAHPDFVSGKVHTRWVDEHIAELARTVEPRQRYVELPRAGAEAGFAGARVNSRDPLALFAHDAAMKAEQQAARPAEDDTADMIGPDGSAGIASPIQGTIVAINVAAGDEVRQGQQVAVVEAMKMEHVITAPHGGIVRKVTMARRRRRARGLSHRVRRRRPRSQAARLTAAAELDLDHIRDDLRENIERHALTLDENRPEAVARRRKTGYRMPRENIARLVDPGSFNEYWPLIVARQHQRHAMEALRKNTPGDGVVAGHVLDQRRPVRRDAFARRGGAL